MSKLVADAVSKVESPATKVVYAHYTTATALGTGKKRWDTTIAAKEGIELDPQSLTRLTCTNAATLRISVTVNAPSSSSDDYIALCVYGREYHGSVARAYATSNSGGRCTFHLHYILSMKGGEYFEIYQRLNGHKNLAETQSDNMLIVEKL